MSAGQRRRRERERRARAAAAGAAGAPGAHAAQAAQQLDEELAREKAVIELSRLRQVVFGWMSEFQAQHGRQPSVQETQERNPGAGRRGHGGSHGGQVLLALWAADAAADASIAKPAQQWAERGVYWVSSKAAPWVTRQQLSRPHEWTECGRL